VVAAPLEAPDALPLAAPLEVPLAAAPELDPLVVEAPLAAPEVDPLVAAVLPELPELVVLPEPVPVVETEPLLPVEVPLAVSEPLVSPEPSPELPICGGFGEPVEHASAPKRAVAVRVFRKVDVIADLLVVGPGGENVTYSVMRFTAALGAVSSPP
jgi:hypothetical protein